MRNTENGVIGSDQTAVMARLALDEYPKLVKRM